MKILVDADSCPVKEIIITLAKKYHLEVYMFFDTSHIYSNDYAKVIIVDKGIDSVDFKLIGYLTSNDIVVTQDYGVATIALSKNAFVINQNGFIYDENNIDTLLFERHLSKTQRRLGKKTKPHKKRTPEQNKSFETGLLDLINKHYNPH
ncbi:hypothetical protein EDC19_0902 [Natranaerovirga hydrolytica]|uniref:UPF0178 protein EDC19_0902 n=1 Tax=Natranaerovirga hydrolytica TaxID=680378 RepID=A0A4R1N0M6_9FIRM|nr:YaiI/YqxD family protein [Natranaerovirga hydrolytica]TCK98480.1 hypothetical protein EDC19_0902 [Natranaerovirga hydrolytica]